MSIPHTRPPVSTRRRRLFTRTRVSGVIAAGLLVTTAIAAHRASADTPLVDRALSLRPGTARIVEANLGQQVNLSRSVAGYTMTINRVYADANRVVVGYTLSGPSGRHFTYGFFIDPTLTDAQGTTLAPAENSGSAPENNAQGGYFAFDAGGATRGAGALALHLSVPYIRAFEKLDGAEPAAVPGEAYSSNSLGRGASSSSSLTRAVTVTGPFVFDLAVPFDPSIRRAPVLEGQRFVQAQRVGGTALTLDQVAVTPTETRLYVRGATTPQISLRLSIDGQDYNQTMNGSWTSADGATVYGFTTPLYDKPGTWTITVTANPQPVTGQPLAGGPWTFHVNAP